MKKIIISIILMLNVSYAQLTFDRTRVIFDHSESSSQSVIVSNTNRQSPYLAQAWIEDEAGNKVTGPLVALPILQRMNPGQDKQIKISIVGDSSALATDRETLLYLNMLGVPPKPDASVNQINLVIQSQLKLFYRPKGLPRYSSTGWVEEMVVKQTRDGLNLQNPTAYHIVIYAISSGGKSNIIEKNVTLKPFSTENVAIKIRGNTPKIYYVNDYGAAGALTFNCSSQDCVLKENQIR